METMRADKAMFYVILAVIFLTLWLLYLNRGSEKIFNVLPIILTTTLAAGLGSLFVVLRPETRTDDFLTLFIYDSKEGHPLLTESYPIRKRFSLEGRLWVRPQGNRATKTDTTPVVDEDRLHDFLMRCIAERLSMRFQNTWLVEAKAWSTPSGDLSLWGAAKEAEKLPKLEFLKDELLEQMRSKGNAFATERAETKGMFGKMVLPPRTKVSYSSQANNRELLLSNPFVRLSITTEFSYWGVLPQPQGFYDMLPQKEGDKDRYYEVSFRVRITANFSSWYAGRGMMTYQKRWVESVIALMRESFDWAPIAQEIKERWTTKQLEKLGNT